MARNLYALLVGIDQYPNESDRLEGCVNDIAAIEQFLNTRLHENKYTRHIKKLINREATRQNVIAGFEHHLSQADKNDVVLFYFCGHGSQELAGEEFAALEYEKEVGQKKLETIVCYDSRTVSEEGTEIRDIADKELRYLIAKVAKNAPHILVVFDCCHSSSGTRDTDRKERVRRLPVDARQPRKYEEFCFADDYAISSRLNQGQFPDGKHIFMSACLFSETAKEMVDEAGKNRGTFSYYLLKELNSLNAVLSYQDLLNEVKGHVHGRRRDQTPQIEAIGMDSQALNHVAFLDDREGIKPRELHFNLIYRPEKPDQSAGWIITGGAAQFLQAGSELAVYPKEGFWDGTERESSQLGSIKIKAVGLEESEVEFISLPEPTEEAAYKAVLMKQPLPAVRFYLEGDAAALTQVKAKLVNSHVVGIETDRSKPHLYRLYAREYRFEITDVDDRPLVPPIAGNGEYDVNKAVRQVEHIARWTQTRQLENPNTGIFKNAIEIKITHNDEDFINSDLQVKHDSKIKLKLKNTTDKPLYCAILDISDSYAVSVLRAFREGGDNSWVCLQPGQEQQAYSRNGRDAIPFTIPRTVRNRGITEYQDVLKLIVSTEAFTTLSQFEQNSLFDQNLSREVGNDQPVIADWMTKQITVTIISTDSIELNPQISKQVAEGVHVIAPSGLKAHARLQPPSSATRSMSSTALPALLDNTEAFHFSTSRSAGQAVSVLELEVDPATIAAVKPDSPLLISVDRPLQPNERVLTIAHDGEFYFPVGIGQTKDNKTTEIKIESLCTPQGVRTGEREIRSAVRLCLRKVRLDKLGQESTYTWLRKATLNPDGTVCYTDKVDVETVKAAVAKANKIVLYIHGIIGDTESMIPSVREAKVNVNGQVKSLEDLYDLVLAFDYESLNTSIENTARKLKQQLAEIGLSPGHGKTLHIVAHSMGGLVSRSFIERENGNTVVSHLIMVGTPNGGSPWATVHDLATTLLSLGLNLSSVQIVPSLLEKLVEAMSVTVREMHTTQSSFLGQLKASADPNCPYSIIAGSTALLPQTSEAKRLLDVLKQKMRHAIELPFRDEENDIAVTVRSIIDVPQGRSPAVHVLKPIACDHLSYFRQATGLHAISSAVSHAFGYPPDSSPPPRSSRPPGPRPVPSPTSLPHKIGVQPAQITSATQVKPATLYSEPSTNGHASVSRNKTQVTSQPSEPISAPPPANPNHETKTTEWFKTTHVLAIGINQYKLPIASLDNAVNDAETIYSLFEEDCLASGEEIKTYKLLDQQATLSGIKQQLEALKTKITKDDRLIFYFAGHGIALHGHVNPESDPNSLELAESQPQAKPNGEPRGYLIPCDAEKGDSETYLCMDYLLDRLGEISCRHCLIILDCCYAGSVQWALLKTREANLGEIYPTVLDRYINQPAWIVLTSSDENEKAQDGEINLEKQLEKNTRGSSTTSNSPFVRLLKEALMEGKADTSPKNGDSIITSTELEQYLRREVSEGRSEENLQTPQQFKVPGKHKGGEFVFLLKKMEEVKKGLKADPDVTADDRHNPYKGLNPFTEENKDCFFGRERVTKKLLEHVQNHRFTIVVGASGAGKSSLVKAGLIPEFRNKSEETIQKRKSEEKQLTSVPVQKDKIQGVSLPISHPDGITQNSNSKEAIQKLEIVAEMRPGQSPGTTFKELLDRLEKIPAEVERLLLIDQLEEIETQCRDEQEKEAFWNLLIEQLKSDSKTLHIVFTLRSDFEAVVQGKFKSAIEHYNSLQKPNLSQSHRGQSQPAAPPTETESANPPLNFDWADAKFNVPAMEPEELQEAIEKPAKEKAVFFTLDTLDAEGKVKRTLVQKLVHEVAGMPGALPLLSFALYTMYRNFAKRYQESKTTNETTIKREIIWEDYDSLAGGVIGSITKRATEEYEKLALQLDDDGNVIKDQRNLPQKEESTPNTYQEMLRWAMLRMVSLDGGQAARRRVRRQELEHAAPDKKEYLDKAIRHFEEARLLVSDEDYVEPAHDALILNWDLLRNWIQEEKESLALRDRLILDVNEWQNLKEAEKNKLKNLQQHVRLQQSILHALGNGFNWTIKKFRVESILKQLNQQEKVGKKRRTAVSKKRHSSDGNTDISTQEPAGLVSEKLSANDIKIEKETPQTPTDNIHQQKSSDLKSKDRLWDKDSYLETVGRQLSKLQTDKQGWLNKTEAEFVLQSLIKRERETLGWTTARRFFGVVLAGLTIWAFNEQRNTLVEQIRTSRESAEANLQEGRDLEALTDILRASKTFDHTLIRGVSFFPIKYQFELGIPNTPIKIKRENAEAERSKVRGTLYKALHATKERNRFQLDRGVIRRVAFHPTLDLVAIVGNYNTIRLYNTVGTAQTSFPADYSVSSLAFTPDGKWLATAGYTQENNQFKYQVKIWEIKDGKIDTSKTPTTEVKQGVISLSFKSKNNHKSDLVAIVTNNYEVQLWKFILPKNNTGKLIVEPVEKNSDSKKSTDSEQPVYQVAFRTAKDATEASQLVTVGISDKITLWDTANDQLTPIKTIYTGQKNVHSVAFDKDGKLATGGEDNTVKFWEIKKQTNGSDINSLNDWNQQPKQFKTEPKNIYGMAFGGDGKLAIFGEDDTVTLLDQSGNTIGKPIQPQDTYVGNAIAGNIAYSPDGKQVAVIAGGDTVRLWDITSGRQVLRFPIPTENYGEAVSLAFSPSGKEFAVGTQKGYVTLWNTYGELLGEKELKVSPEESGQQSFPIQRLMFNSNGTKLAVFGKNESRLQLGTLTVSLSHKEPLGEFNKFSDSVSIPIKDLVFNSNFDRILIIEENNTVRLWNKQNSSKSQQLPTQANSVAFSPNNQFFATAGQDGAVKLWKIDGLKTDGSSKPFLTLQTHQRNIQSIAFNPLDSSSLITGGEDGTIRLWDLSGNKPAPLSMENSKIQRVAWISHSKRFATLDKVDGQARKLLLWEWNGQRFELQDIASTELGKFQSSSEVKFTVFRPDSDDLMTITKNPMSKDSIVELWNREGKRIAQLDQEQTKQAEWLAWSDDGKTLATVEVIQLPEAQCGRNGKGKPKLGNKVKLWKFEDGKFSLLVNNGRDKSDLEILQNQQVKNSPVICSLALSADGRQLATTLSKPLGRVKLWDTLTGKEIRPFQTQQGTIESIAFSSDGKRLATVGGEKARTLRLWDNFGNQLALIQENLSHARFSPDSKLLAGVSDQDSQLMVWDVSGDRFNLLYGKQPDQNLAVRDFAFNPDGQFATVGQDGKVHFWQVDKKQLLTQACDMVWSYLQRNPEVAQNDRELCKAPSTLLVSQQSELLANQAISTGERILLTTENNPTKLAGVEAIASGNFSVAEERLKTSLSNNPNDPEARIYLNNALIGHQNAYTIAVPVPLSSNPDGAAEVLRGVAQAQEEINKSGGLNGTFLRVMIADDQGDPEMAKQVAQQVADNPDVLGVVGHFSSGTTRKAGEIYQQQQLAAISPVSTAVEPTGLLDFNSHIFGNSYLFRTVPNDQRAAIALVNHLRNQLKQEKVAVFFNSKNEYSKSLASEFEKAFGNSGGQLLVNDVSELNFNPYQQVKAAMDNNAQALILLTDTGKLDTTLEIAKANDLLSRQQNRKALGLLAGDDIYTLKTLQEGRKAVIGMTIAVPWHIDSNRDFAKKANKLWHGTVNWRTAMAYDATQAFIEALQQNATNQCIAQSSQTKEARGCIIQTLRSEEFLVSNGASGKVQFEPSGDRNQESQLVQIVQTGDKSRSNIGFDFEIVK